MVDPIPSLIAQVDAQRLRADLFYLSHDPLPFRKLNYTRPGQTRCSLYEADDFIQARLEGYGYRYADPNYHLVTDRPEFVDIENVRLAVQASLAAIVRVADGYSG